MVLSLSIYDFSCGIVPLNATTHVNDKSQINYANKTSPSTNSTENGPSYDSGEFKNHVASSSHCSIFTDTIAGYGSSHNVSLILSH